MARERRILVFFFLVLSPRARALRGAFRREIGRANL